MKEPVSILKEALLTEKATSLSSNFNKYVFSVASFASKSNKLAPNRTQRTRTQTHPQYRSFALRRGGRHHCVTHQ